MITLGLGWRMHVRVKARSSSEPLDFTVRVVRVSDLNWFRRAWLRVYVAAAHGWRTKFAPFDWYLLVEHEGRMIGLEGAVLRKGTVAGEPAMLGLPGALLVHPNYRRKGLAAELSIRTRELLAEHGAEFSVGFCEDPLVKYYEGLGWEVVPNEMVYQRFGEEAAVELNVLVRALTDRELPPGPIDIRGLPV